MTTKNKKGPAIAQEGKKLIGQATPAEIAAWKEKYTGGIYAVEVNDHIAYFKNPGRAEVNVAFAATRSENSKYLDLVEKFMDLCFIGGSELILTEDALFLGACLVVREKMDGVPARIKNL